MISSSSFRYVSLSTDTCFSNIYTNNKTYTSIYLFQTCKIIQPQDTHKQSKIKVFHFREVLIMDNPYQPPLLDIKNEAKKNSYISYFHILIKPIIYSSPPQTGHTPPPPFSSSCLFSPLCSTSSFQPFPLQHTPPLF